MSGELTESPGHKTKPLYRTSGFEIPALFALEEGKDFRTPSQLYRAVARQLETNLLAGN